MSAMMIAAGAGLIKGRSAMRRAAELALTDSGLHRSPNAGWPEAAMAGALGVSLAGPRHYGGELVMEASVNASGSTEARVGHVTEAISIFLRACDCLVLLVFAGILVSF